MSEPFSLGAAMARVPPGRPLIVTDADEVLLRFVDGFDRFLKARGLFLDLVNYRLHGNVKRQDDRTAVLDVEVTALLDEFRGDLDSLEACDGALDVLSALKDRASVVVLTNINPSQAAARARNLTRLGLDVPLVANSGWKGPAVRQLASRAGAPSFFLDDVPQHLASTAEAAPEVFRIHIVGDDRLKGLQPPCEHAHLRAADWRSAGAFIGEELAKAGY
jgi:hypothetical protein